MSADKDAVPDRPVSRRDFLILAARFGAGLTALGGLGSLAAACGATPVSSSTTGASPMTTAPVQTTLGTVSTY